LVGKFGKGFNVSHRSQSSIENYKRQNHFELFCA
jgi:hypothetical protein